MVCRTTSQYDFFLGHFLAVASIHARSYHFQELAEYIPVVAAFQHIKLITLHYVFHTTDVVDETLLLSAKDVMITKQRAFEELLSNSLLSEGTVQWIILDGYSGRGFRWRRKTLLMESSYE
jgi:hypothetical protein